MLMALSCFEECWKRLSKQTNQQNIPVEQVTMKELDDWCCVETSLITDNHNQEGGSKSNIDNGGHADSANHPVSPAELSPGDSSSVPAGRRPVASSFSQSKQNAGTNEIQKPRARAKTLPSDLHVNDPNLQCSRCGCDLGIRRSAVANVHGDVFCSGCSKSAEYSHVCEMCRTVFHTPTAVANEILGPEVTICEKCLGS